MDELAQLSIRRGDKLYRIKVFANTVRIEQQLGGDSQPVNRQDYDVYDEATSAWDFDVLGRLIDVYQARNMHEQLENWNNEGGAGEQR